MEEKESLFIAKTMQDLFNETQDLKNEIKKLKRENKELQDRIDKATEYIKLNFCNNENIFDCWHSDIREILCILKENN